MYKAQITKSRFLIAALAATMAMPVAAQEFSLTTLFAWNNGNAPGGGVYFDLENIGTSAITIDSWDTNVYLTTEPRSAEGFDAAQAAGEAPQGGPEASVYFRTGTYSGFEMTATGWTLMGTTSVTPAGDDLPTHIPVGGLVIQPGEVYGIAISVTGGIGSNYTDGTGGNQIYMGDGLMISTGTANNELFVGGTFSPRVWNGTVYFDAEAPDEARFLVEKDFDDDNEASVEVTLSCNTGLPLEQTTMIEENDPVNFVVGDFVQGNLNCEITETPIDGYSTSYAMNAPTGVEGDDGSCLYTQLTGGQYYCQIDNNLQDSVVSVTKQWLDENPDSDPYNVANANWSCSNVALDLDGLTSGSLTFYAEGTGAIEEDTETFTVKPSWDMDPANVTTCSIVEGALTDGGVEADDSDCQSLTIVPGGAASCTIINTRIYEGIPTLSQYGLGILALMMLGMGFVGFRRFV